MKPVQKFHPLKISRRSEVYLWALAFLSLAALVLIRIRLAQISPWYAVFAALMLLMAASTTLSNWMDQKTVLILKPEGLEFRNGLREVSLHWDEVQEVQVFPSRWGKQVHVAGTETHFSFRTKSELIHKGEVRAKMGFIEGEYILEQILKNSGLREKDQTGDGRYYARP